VTPRPPRATRLRARGARLVVISAVGEIGAVLEGHAYVVGSVRVTEDGGGSRRGRPGRCWPVVAAGANPCRLDASPALNRRGGAIA